MTTAWSLPPYCPQSTPYNTTLSSDYVANVSVLLRRQVALAGYRLAQVLDIALANVTEPEDGPALRGMKPTAMPERHL